VIFFGLWNGLRVRAAGHAAIEIAVFNADAFLIGRAVAAQYAAAS